jgi:hypothetical protein
MHMLLLLLRGCASFRRRVAVTSICAEHTTNFAAGAYIAFYVCAPRIRATSLSPRAGADPIKQGFAPARGTTHRSPIHRLKAGSRGQRFSDRGLFSCPMLQRQVLNRDGTRRYRCPVQSKFAVARRPPEEPTVRTALTVPTPSLGPRTRDKGVVLIRAHRFDSPPRRQIP